MTPLHSMVKNALLPALLANTQVGREQADQQKEFSPDPKIVKAMKELRENLNYGSVKNLIALFGRDDLIPYLDSYEGKRSKIPLVVLSVVRDNGKLLIVTHGADRHIFTSNGNEDYASASPVYATDEEVEKCLDELTVLQLRKIFSLAIFAPILAGLFQEETELVAERDEYGLKPGDRVVRGPDWRWGDQDGGVGNEGVVSDKSVSHPDYDLRVIWDNGTKSNMYRNREGARDLQLAEQNEQAPLPPF